MRRGWGDSVFKIQALALCTIGLSNLLLFIALVTPAWQVAYDKDARRYVYSGLWMYCSGDSSCWYIFSDDLINYYEKVDVCRFFLIGDCRKKLVRTPYFFNWHYSVLLILILTFAIGICAVCSMAISIAKGIQTRFQTCLFSVLAFTEFVMLCISIAIFMANAEMLESRYLIGIKETFPKEYGYSFYFACFALVFLLFALLSALTLITFTFLLGNRSSEVAEFEHSLDIGWQKEKLYVRPSSKVAEYGENRCADSILMIPSETNIFDHPPRPGSNIGSRSITPSQQAEYVQSTRTFLSY